MIANPIYCKQRDYNSVQDFEITKHYDVNTCKSYIMEANPLWYKIRTRGIHYIKPGIPPSSRANVCWLYCASTYGYCEALLRY